MKLQITVYTDESLKDIKREVEADRLKIPYRVAMEAAKSLEDLNIEDRNDILAIVTGNLESVDKIMKATFGITDTELECIDASEMAAVVKEIYSWAVDKMKMIGGNSGKN